MRSALVLSGAVGALAVIVGGPAAGWPRAAWAHDESTSGSWAADVTPDPAAAEVTQFLPTTSGAAVAPARSVTTAWGGFDGAGRTPVLSIGTEVRIVRRLALLVGAGYDQSGAASPTLRPRVGARVQVLAQDASGLDLGVSLAFRQDRFTSEDGMIQGAVALARSFGATSLVGNVVYAQDGEGDDYEGELRLAALHRVRGGLHLGVEGRYMRLLDSKDAHRQEHSTPSLEAAAGPIVAYMAGSWLLAVEAGYSARRTDRLQNGLAMLGGVGAAF